MKCCTECFIDIEIKSIISSYKIEGNCDFCDAKNVSILDLDNNSNELNTLVSYFYSLLDIYTKANQLPISYPKEKISLLKTILYNDWNIFNCKEDIIYRLLVKICNKRYLEEPELFDQPVGISQLYNNKYLSDHSIIQIYSWEEFKNKIKNENRFHHNIFNIEKFHTVLTCLIGYYQKDTAFYRARISPTSNGFPLKEMSAPPKEFTTAGRANSEGIRVLYLSNSEETALREVRAITHDYVSIGKFKLKNDITIIDFSKIDKISPFASIDAEFLAINLNHLKHIRSEISKPLRRHDSPLEYLPTQYLCDYIKNIGYDGIKYPSTVNPTGYNLAIFNPEKFQCEEKNVYEIKSLIYNHSMVSKK